MPSSSFYTDGEAYDEGTVVDNAHTSSSAPSKSPSSFYPEGNIYDALSDSDTVIAQMTALELATEAAAASGATSATSSSASATAAAASAATASAALGLSLLKANNLSDVANSATARTNLQAALLSTTPLSGVDLNVVLASGTYAADATATNTPYSSHWYIEVQVHPTNGTYCRQIARSAISTQQEWWSRVMIANAWQSWQQVVIETVAPTGTGAYVKAISPALTGAPTAPTATVGTNTTQIATTAFVIANGGSGAVRYDAPQALDLPALKQAQDNINLPSILRRPMEAWLPKWGAARANVLAGTSNAKLLCLGDSTIAGFGAKPSNANSAAYSLPAILAQQLTANGLNSSWQSRWTDNEWVLSGVALGTADSRVSMGAWTVGAAATLGGRALLTQSIGSPLTFTPTSAVDSFDFYYFNGPGQGSLTLSFNGGTTTTINEVNASYALAMATKTGTLGAATLTVQQSSATPVYCIGVVAYDSTVKEVSVINAGWSGANASAFSDSAFPFSSIGTLSFLAPDLTIIDLTINDANGGTSLSAYQTSLQAIITQAAVSGDVILLGGVPVVTTASSTARQLAVNNMAAAVAAKNKINFISMIDLWGSQAAIATAGYGYADGIHMNSSGYAAQAAIIAPLLQ